MKKQEEVAAVAAPAAELKPPAPVVASEPEPMDIDFTETKPVAAPAATAPKKKKKKASYKNMMANMMAGTEKKDVAKEREALAKGLGGGAFSKIDKI